MKKVWNVINHINDFVTLIIFAMKIFIVAYFFGIFYYSFFSDGETDYD
jgi:hypothetical protein